MKKYIVATILFLAILNSSFSQETKNVKQQLTREDYLKKSKNQKIAGWVLLGAGLASFIIVAPGNSSFETTGTVVVIGGIAVLSSVPLFIASGRNKRKAKAASAYLNLERISTNQFTLNKTKYLPSLSVKLNL